MLRTGAVVNLYSHRRNSTRKQPRRSHVRQGREHEKGSCSISAYIVISQFERGPISRIHRGPIGALLPVSYSRFHSRR